MSDIKIGGSMDLTIELSRIAREVDRARHTISSVEARVKGEKPIPEATAKVTDISKILLDAAESLMDFFDRSIEKEEETLKLIGDLNKWIETLPKDSRKEGTAIVDKINKNVKSVKDDFNSMFPVMGFQDLAGQRLKKLFADLYNIEKKVITIAVSTGMDLSDHEQRLIDELNDDSLPLIIRQDRVDEILNKFGV